MEYLFPWLQAHLPYAPLAIFCALMLAGLFVPVSEDGMIFIAALLSNQYPSMIIPLIVATFAGAYLSDLLCFVIGRYLGSALLQSKSFQTVLPSQKIHNISYFYHRYGTIILITFRFIPFGFRNALFFSAGISKMSIRHFILADLVACLLTFTTYFALYYYLGQQLTNLTLKINIIIMAIITSLLLLFYLLKRN